MSRPKRNLRKKFIIFCEGDTEYKYKGQDAKKYIEQTLAFGSIDNFKAKRDVYEYLNTKGNSFKQMLERLNTSIIVNHYQINRQNFEIIISETDVLWDNEDKRGSNINEFFEVIDW